MRVGVEVGGTFTDLVAIGDDGRLQVTKVPSTPARPDEGALNAIDSAGLDLSQVEDLVHGSTVATNAILERKGARVLMVVTEGTRDILLIQRHNRRRIFQFETLEALSRIARDDALLLFASDHMDYVAWALAEARRHTDWTWTARTAADWRTPPEDWIPTRYETKAIRKGDMPAYLAFRRVARTGKV